jgi:hypothetical protein
VEEAEALMTELTGVDRGALLAERAEAEAQLRAAEATLGIPPPATNGQAGAQEEEPDAVDPGGQTPASEGTEPAVAGSSLDFDVLRRAADAAREADDELARAASEAAERPLPTEPSADPGPDQLRTAESAFARALEIREDLPAAWRRLVGALISATGMAIVVGALGWSAYWLLVPIALIAIMTVDLRVAGKSAVEASTQAARELASVGVAGTGGLDQIRLERARIEEAESRLADARARRDAAYAEFEEMAPGRVPSEVESIIADHEAELAEAAAKAEAEAQALAKAEAEARQAEADEKAAARQAEPPVPAPAAEADQPPAPVPAPVRALAERLSAEGRQALARIEAQLAALDRVELAQRSLKWHDERSGSNGNGADPAPPPNG